MVDIETVFSRCVQLLSWLSVQIGVSYEAVNVWIFCIIWPALTLALLIMVVRRRRPRRQSTDAFALREELIWAAVFAKCYVDPPIPDSTPIQEFRNAEHHANEAVKMFRTYSK